MLFTMMYRYAPTGDVLGRDPIPSTPQTATHDVVDLAGAMTKRTGMPYWAVPQLYNLSFSPRTRPSRPNMTRPVKKCALSPRLGPPRAPLASSSPLWNIRNPAIPVPVISSKLLGRRERRRRHPESLEPRLRLTPARIRHLLGMEGKPCHPVRANDGSDCFTSLPRLRSRVPRLRRRLMRSLYGLTTTAGDNTEFTDGIAADILYRSEFFP